MALIGVVDDDPTFAELLTDLLSDEGHQVQVYHRADQALDLLPQTLPAVVIVDVHVEALTVGAALIAELRMAPVMRQTPLILCSGDTRYLRSQHEALKGLGCCILEKPFGVDELLTVLDEALDPAEPACVVPAA